MKYYQPTLAQMEIYYDLISLPKEKLGYLVTANSIIIEGDFDPYLYQKAAKYVRSNSDNFQLRFKIIDNEPKIYLADNLEYTIEVVDYSFKDNALKTIEENLLDIAYERHYEIEDNELFSETIYILPENKYLLVLYCNHIIIDAYGYSRYLKAVSTKYNSLLSDKNAKIDFQEFKEEIEFDNEYRQSQKYQSDLNYWQENLKSFPPKIEITPIDIFTSRLNRITFKSEGEEFLNVKNIVNELGLSIHTYYMTIFNLLLNRISGNTDIVTCITLLNRNTSSSKRDFGLYTTAVPIRVKIDPEISLLDLTSQIRKITKLAKEHQKTPLSEINRIINEENYLNNHWKEISFTSRIADFNTRFGESSVTESVNHFSREANMVLLFEVDTYNISNEVIFRLTYNESLFTKEAGAKLLDLYNSLFANCAKYFEKPVKEIMENICFFKPAEKVFEIVFDNKEIEKEFTQQYDLNSDFIVVNRNKQILPEFLTGDVALKNDNIDLTGFLGYYLDSGTVRIIENRNNIIYYKGEIILQNQLKARLLSIKEVQHVKIFFDKQLLVSVVASISQKEFKSKLRKVLPAKFRPKISNYCQQ